LHLLHVPSWPLSFLFGFLDWVFFSPSVLDLYRIYYIVYVHVCLLLLVLAVTSILARRSNGVIEVDGDTIDKVLDGSKYALVEFVEFSWKDSPDFAKVGEEYVDRNDVLVLKVDTSDSPTVKERFGLPSTLPFIKFYTKGSTTPEDYAGSLSAPEVIDYVNGHINPTLSHLKKYASDFVANAEQVEVIAKAEGLIKDLSAKSSEYANYVIGHMKKIQSKGKEYITQEKARLNNLIANKATVEKKQKEFKKRLAALELFKHD